MSISMTYPQLLRRAVLIDGNEHTLGPKVHALVALLLMRRGEIVSHQEIIDAVYGPSDPARRNAMRCITWMLCHHRCILSRYVRPVKGQGLIIDRKGLHR